MSGAAGQGRPGLAAFRALAAKEWLALWRDPLAVLTLFGVPLVFIVTMTLALQNAFAPPRLPADYQWIDADHGALARELRAAWVQRHGEPLSNPQHDSEQESHQESQQEPHQEPHQEPQQEPQQEPWQRGESTPHWQQSLRESRVGYVVVIDAGFSQRVVQLEDTGARIADAPRAHVWLEPGANPALQLAARATLDSLVGELRARTLMAQWSSLPVRIRAEDIEAYTQIAPVQGTVQPTAAQHNVPAWLAFGMFFIVVAQGGLVVQERLAGTLRRLRAMGVGTFLFLIAKAVPWFGLNLLQALAMLAAGAWLLPALGAQGITLRGVDAPALACAVAATSVCAIGVGLLVSSLCRTALQAIAAGGAVCILLAAIGGVMVPAFVMPTAMQAAARVSPMNWALQAMSEVLVRGGGTMAILPHCAALAATGFVAVALAAWQLHRA